MIHQKTSETGAKKFKGDSEGDYTSSGDDSSDIELDDDTQLFGKDGRRK